MRKQYLLAALTSTAIACGGETPNGNGNGNTDGDGKPQPGTLVVKSTPPGARVVLDNDPLNARTTPATYTNLAVGPHRLDFSLDGHASTTREFMLADVTQPMTVEVTLAQLVTNPIVRPGETPTFPVGTIAVAMNRPDSSGEIIVTPDGADAIATGMQSPAEFRVQAGRQYTVSLKKDDLLSSSERVSVDADARTEITARLALNLNGIWRLVEVNGGPPMPEETQPFVVDPNDSTCGYPEHQAGDGCLHRGSGKLGVLTERQVHRESPEGVIMGTVEGDNIVRITYTPNGAQPRTSKWVRISM